MKVISFLGLNWFIKTIKPIVNCSNNLWKKLLLFFGIFGHINHVVFRKSKPKPFLIIEKTTLTFQTLNEFVSDSYLNNKGRNVPCRVEK